VLEKKNLSSLGNRTPILRTANPLFGYYPARAMTALLVTSEDENSMFFQIVTSGMIQFGVINVEYKWFGRRQQFISLINN
jgi:hypothetical protein